jgi:hypothetical protein
MKLIVFCGYPQTGKDHASRILQRYGIPHHDDKGILRDLTRMALMLDEWQVSTQEGKACVIAVNGVETTVRQAMADLGSYFENTYGKEFFAHRTIRDLSAYRGRGECFVISSARLSQPAVYRRAGALVIELKSEGFGAIVSTDEYDAGAAAITIHNNGDERSFETAVLKAVLESGYLDADAHKGIREMMELALRRTHPENTESA